jgi:transcription factor E2F7/8
MAELPREPKNGDEMGYLDAVLGCLIRAQVAPFLVTKDYKIRREYLGGDGESEAERMNIQERILGYNRKDKSLMELTRKFINKFEGAPSTTLMLDRVTSELGVERRRIYDIINIMESLGVVNKIKKNVYQWKGLRCALDTIETYAKGSPTIPSDCKYKKEKSLESLSTEFLKLFAQRKTCLSLE